MADILSISAAISPAIDCKIDLMLIASADTGQDTTGEGALFVL
jgi:hypothetical protein